MIKDFESENCIHGAIAGDEVGVGFIKFIFFLCEYATIGVDGLAHEALLLGGGFAIDGHRKLLKAYAPVLVVDMRQDHGIDVHRGHEVDAVVVLDHRAVKKRVVHDELLTYQEPKCLGCPRSGLGVDELLELYIPLSQNDIIRLIALGGD